MRCSGPTIESNPRFDSMAFARSGEGKGPFRNEWPASGAYQPVGGEDPLQRARMHPLAARARSTSTWLASQRRIVLASRLASGSLTWPSSVVELSQRQGLIALTAVGGLCAHAVPYLAERCASSTAACVFAELMTSPACHDHEPGSASYTDNS